MTQSSPVRLLCAAALLAAATGASLAADPMPGEPGARCLPISFAGCGKQPSEPAVGLIPYLTRPQALDLDSATL